MIYSIYEEEFRKYGQIIQGLDMGDFCKVLKTTPVPEDGFVYRASDEALESHSVFQELKDRVFGGMPIQLGYCNGRNSRLNCLEYHKDSEVCIMAYDTILFLGFRGDIREWKYDTSLVKTFMVPAGTGIELYATTLHYAPCSVSDGEKFQVANGLPLGTNAPKPDIAGTVGEDRFLFGRNKWLLAHAEAQEAKEGACVALTGKNLTITT